MKVRRKNGMISSKKYIQLERKRELREMQEEFKERTKGWEEDIQAIETEIKSRNPIKELQERCKMAKIINETEKERKTQEEKKKKQRMKRKIIKKKKKLKYFKSKLKNQKKKLKSIKQKERKKNKPSQMK